MGSRSGAGRIGRLAGEQLKREDDIPYEGVALEDEVGIALGFVRKSGVGLVDSHFGLYLLAGVVLFDAGDLRIKSGCVGSGAGIGAGRVGNDAEFLLSAVEVLEVQEGLKVVGAEFGGQFMVEAKTKRLVFLQAVLLGA